MTTPGFDELNWVIQIRKTLDQDHENGDGSDEDDTDFPISIFNVPKTLMSTHPDSYTPQQVAVGPYHHWRAELYEMERYKLAVAKRMQKHALGAVRFRTLVDELTKFEHGVRGCYHKFLDLNGETLAWMMAMDACFLLEFLQVYASREGKLSLYRVSSRMSHLGRRSAHNAILRDIVMLENQLPLFVLRKILELFRSSSTEEESDSVDDLLASMVRGFCEEVFPFKMAEGFPDVHISDAHHLLDLLYRMIAPKIERSQSETSFLDDSEDPKNDEKKDGFFKNLLKKAIFSSMFLIRRLLCSRPVILFLKLPLTIVSRLPIISILETVCFPQSKEVATKSGRSENSCLHNKPPSVEEIAIPAVADLSKYGVSFAPTDGGISAISFDPQTVTLRLPIVSLDANSEVVLRNLVAYEEAAAGANGALVFTRYTELMNGIVDSEEDARILRESGIIWNGLKSDGEAAKLWNGMMSRSMRLRRVEVVEKVIEEVNKYYNGRWSVRGGKLMKRYVFGSWQLLTFLAAILLLLLITLQAFCSLYNSPLR